jgi:anti-sigma factor RsiW
MRSDSRMTCQQFNDFVMDYVSCELSQGVRIEFERHLSACPNCVRYIESYKTTIAVGRVAFDSLEHEPPAADVPEELIQAILAAQRKA